MDFHLHPRDDRSLFPALAAFAVAALLALVSRGLAGDEEVAHFLMARHGFAHPALFLSLAGRPLVTLGFALPAQAGLLAARLAAAVVTGLGAYAVARLARLSGFSPWWAVGYLLAQPFFLAHAGRVMTEPCSAALLAWGLLALASRRLRLLAVLTALAPLARMEFLVFWLPVVPALWRGRARRWLLVLPAGLLAWNLGGALATGDPLWLLHQSNWKAYPQRDALHYLKSYAWTVGLVVFVPAFLGLWRLGTLLVRRGPAAEAGLSPEAGAIRRRAWISSGVVVLVLYLIYTVFAAWHPITFGNLRYLAAAGPALAFLATAATGEFLRRGPNRVLASGLAVVLAGAILLWNHPLLHDFGRMATRDPLPALVVAGWILLAALPPGFRRVLPVALLVLGPVDLLARHLGALSLTPTPEQLAVRRAAGMLRNPLPPGVTFYNGHPLLAYDRGEDLYDRQHFPALMNRTAGVAEPGSILFWETHYAMHAGSSLEIRSFFDNPGWKYLAGVVSADSSWAGAYFTRLAADSAGAADSARVAEAASLVAPALPGAVWRPAAVVIQAGIPVARADTRLDPDNPDHWRRLAQRLALVRQDAAAAAALDRAMELSPGNPINYAMKAELLRFRRRLPEALEAARKALTMRPEDPLIEQSVGQILLDMNRAEEATPYLVASADGLSQRPDIQLVAGKALFDLGRYREAEPYLLAALKLAPGQVDAVILASVVALRTGRPEVCKERLRAFIRNRPREAVPYLALGDILLQEQKPRDAQAVWEDGLKQTGGDPAIASRLESLHGPPAQERD